MRYTVFVTFKGRAGEYHEVYARTLNSAYNKRDKFMKKPEVDYAWIVDDKTGEAVGE